jgi:hypothetical protein
MAVVLGGFGYPQGVHSGIQKYPYNLDAGAKSGMTKTSYDGLLRSFWVHGSISLTDTYIMWFSIHTVL